MAEQEPTSALDLALAPREHIRVHGVTYDVASMSSLGIAASAVLTRAYERAAELEKLGENATEDDEREYVDRLRVIARIAVPTLPLDVLDQLGLGDLKAVTLDFFERHANSPLGRAIMRSLRQIAKQSLTSSRTLQESTAPANGS